MVDYIVTSRVWVARSRPEVFAFFATPANLLVLTPPRLRPRMLGAPPTMAAGSVFDLALRWLGVPIRWRVFIREYDPPFRFVDVQVRGPFDRWEHRHRFLERDGGTVVDDRIVYRLPLGPLGRLAHAALVRRQLDGLWAHRRDVLTRTFGTVRTIEDPA